MDAVKPPERSDGQLRSRAGPCFARGSLVKWGKPKGSPMKPAAAIIAAFAVAACATPSPQETALIQSQAARQVTCMTGDDCDVKWGKALQWVLNHSDYRVQVQSETLIQTFGPLPNSASPAYIITKAAMGGGSFLIDFRAGCDNIFGCIPDPVRARADFVVTLMGQ